MEPPFFSNPSIFIDFSIENVKRVLESIDLGIAVILVFAFFGKHPFFFSKIDGMLDLGFFNVKNKMGVESYPFQELMVNLASWTP